MKVFKLIIIVILLIIVIFPFIKKDNLNKIKITSAVTLVSKTNIKIKANSEELIFFKDGYLPWISLLDPNVQLPRLVDPNYLVIPYDSIILVISYPLKKPKEFLLTNSKGGWTKQEIILEICKIYNYIYNNDAKNNVLKKSIRDTTFYSRESFDILGHDLKDLDLSGFEVHLINNKLKLFPLVES